MCIDTLAEADMNLARPIALYDIPNFERWINWNGWVSGPIYQHHAYDFAAYIRTNGDCVLGLPPSTPVRAIADGQISTVYRPQSPAFRGYGNIITIAHPGRGDITSKYTHICPLIEPGQHISRGEKIATLWRDTRSSLKWLGESEEDNIGRLVHLHFELSHSGEAIDPVTLFPELGALTAEPFGSQRFRVLQLRSQPQIRMANFKKLLC